MILIKVLTVSAHKDHHHTIGEIAHISGYMRKESSGRRKNKPKWRRKEWHKREISSKIALSSLKSLVVTITSLR
jgi:hypothetical protein